MTIETTTIITIEHLGPTATSADLDSFAELFSEVCNGDDRVTLFDLSPMGDRLTIEVEGTVTAEALATEIFEGKHGAW